VEDKPIERSSNYLVHQDDQEPRMRRITPNYLYLAALGLLFAANVHAYEWNIGPWRAPLAGPAPPTLEFSGLWPDTCIPRLLDARLADGTLQLRTQSGSNQCLQSDTLFSIPVQLVPQISGANAIAWLHRRENEADYQLYGYRLHNPHTFPALEPSSGWWWPEPEGPNNSGGPGTGLTVDYQQGLLTLVSQAYDPLGNPEWQLATGTLRGEVFNAPLIRFSDGQTLTGQYRLPELSVGRDELSVQFHSALSATAWFSHRRGTNLDSPIDLRSVSMIRYMMNPPVLERLLTGRWLVTTKRDSGNTPLVDTVRIQDIALTDSNQLNLLNARGDGIGNCELQPNRPEAAPVTCTLNGLALFGKISISSVGFDRMDGHDESGRQILVIRMPR
jgi:hypothetical protein